MFGAGFKISGIGLQYIYDESFSSQVSEWIIWYYYFLKHFVSYKLNLEK